MIYLHLSEGNHRIAITINLIILLKPKIKYLAKWFANFARFIWNEISPPRLKGFNASANSRYFYSF